MQPPHDHAAGPTVLHLSSSSGFFGAEAVVLHLLRRPPAGGRALLASFLNRRNPHLELCERAAAAGVSARSVPCSGPLDPLALARLVRLVRRERVDVLHAHGYKADVYGLAAAKLARAACVTTQHGDVLGDARGSLYVRAQRRAGRSFDRVVCVSDALRDAVERAGTAPARVRRIDNGVETEAPPLAPTARRAARHAWGVPSEAFLVGAAGRLSPEKGFDVLIEAAALLAPAHPDVWFVVAGDGPEAARLREAAALRGLTARLRFVGVMTEMALFHGAVDALALPSRSEGLPMIVLEAMANGLPVAATAVGSVPRAVREGETGHLVAPGDAPALAGALSRLVVDRPRARVLGEAGRALARAEFGADAMARRYEAVYREVLAQRSRT